MDWETFKKQKRTDWKKLDSLTLKECKKIKRMCRGCKVTMLEASEIIMEISNIFKLSPDDSFEIFKNKGFV